MSVVLLVDDSPADRILFRTILGREGFVVHEISKGLDAVARARELRPHAIVLDVNLPDTDGHAVCRALRQDSTCAGLPVLMLTIKGRDDDVLAGLEAGADDYVSKDEAPAIILARVRRLVQLRKLATISVLNEQLAQVGRLVAGIVHEIRGPLTVIRGHAELIALHSGHDSALAGSVEPILRSVKTLQQRLDHLMAAVKAGHCDPRPTDLHALLKESVNLFLKGNDPRQAIVQVELDAEPNLPVVHVDPGRMMQVLINLLANAQDAIYAHRSQGRVRVSLRSVPEVPPGILIEVADDGPGIAADSLHRIFEPFFTTKEAGTGYGLYLAAEILKEHGGQLSARNLANGGACLSLWLPVTELDSSRALS